MSKNQNNLNNIIVKFLDDNNFDGLVNTHAECGCDKTDLAPCGQPNFENCEAALKTNQDGEVLFTAKN